MSGIKRSHIHAIAVSVLLGVAALFSTQARASDPVSATAQWSNSPLLSSEMLRGKVVLVEFSTYGCVNCRRTLPYVKAGSAKYRQDGLLVIGVHTPEFGFKKDKGNVERAVRELGITYPVVMDNQYEIWNVCQNRYWPAQYLMDARGAIRYRHFGEDAYQETGQMIQKLLAETQSRPTATG